MSFEEASLMSCLMFAIWGASSGIPKQCSYDDTR